MRPLFIDVAPSLPKTAAPSTRLSDQADQWHVEVSRQLFKQLPFISDFETEVHLDEKDDQQGYAFGSVDVRSRSARPIPESGPGELSNVKSCRIPVIIRERQLLPMDVFLVDGTAYPMTEDRFRQHMLREELFDAIDKPAPDPSLVPQLYPPYRSRYGFGGSYEIKEGALMEMVIPTVSDEQREAVKQALKEEPGVIELLKGNGGLKSLAPLLKEAQADLQDRTESMRSWIKPTVLQIRREPTGQYMLKRANPAAFDPREELMDPATAETLAGKDLVAKADADGAVTVSSEILGRQTLTNHKFEVVPDFGEWRVESLDGRQLLGWVFPTVLDFEMNALPLALFTNGSESTIQESIAGSRVGQGTNFPYKQPKGYGTFVHSSEGRAMCTIPVTVRSSTTGPDGQTWYDCSDFYGTPVLLAYGKGLRQITKSGAGYLMPDSFRFMPLGGQVDLAPDPSLLKHAQLEAIHPMRSELLSDGGTWSFRGFMAEKVAEPTFMSKDDTEFYLVAAGLAPSEASEKVAEAANSSSPVPFIARRDITLFEDHLTQSAMKVASMDIPDLAQNTIKVAALIQDPMSVDTVLSLNFINPENISGFVDSIPLLEEVQQRLAEQLLASRLGVPEIPELATEHAIKALEKVLAGLKSLAGNVEVM